MRFKPAVLVVFIVVFTFAPLLTARSEPASQGTLEPSSPLQGEQIGPQREQLPGPGAPPSAGDEDKERARMQKDMLKRANQQRQAQLKRDTEKLLKLATELQTYVDKSNENILSLDVIKKADEIEKLAHSVKDKMKGNF